MVIGSLHITSKNIGDNVSTPFKYFNFSKRKINFNYIAEIDDLTGDIIVGGGGLLGHFSVKKLERLTELKISNKINKMILWGVGFNFHYDTEVDVKVTAIIDAFLEQCDLIGIRDRDLPYHWVPCASCMSRFFIREYKITKDIVIYEHKDVPIDITGHPKMSNANLNFNEVINFLGSSRVIITNSYHGVYWGTLLNKKVLVIPFATRFDNFKHPPTITNLEQWKGAVGNAIQYPDALRECRDATIDFYKLVDNVLI